MLSLDRRHVLGVGMLVLSALAPPAASAAEATCDYYIDTVPFVIDQRAHYCLAGSLTYAGQNVAIDIEANDVTLDLRGHRISGLPAGPGTHAYGIYAYNRTNLTIRNGIVRGFLIGVILAGGARNNNNVIEDINADSNTWYAIHISSPGSNNVVRRCIVASTGGGTGNSGNAPTAISIWSSLSFAIDNIITGTNPNAGEDPATESSYGMILSGPDSRAINNQIIGNGHTENYYNVCLSFWNEKASLYRDNVASRCGRSYMNGTPVGTTNY